ncbi:DUF3422 family protein [Aestuariispira ectoiniformans]|uniref:DUF3422 family protein n=1 Tax=Aestuariispira ectoiniformans TaxID=2775080 RepID=UPI00223B5B90|nr:DUF3422 domain-containing protein [Aestuariispira ectoiniformans]
MTEQKNILRTNGIPDVEDHPLRYDLTNELHARPFEPLSAPEQITYYAMTTGEGVANRDREHVCRLCERYGLHPPAANASHFSADFGEFRLRWERHTEFSTYAIMRSLNVTSPFMETPVSYAPSEWIEAMPGQRLVALHIVFLSSQMPKVSDEDLDRYFVTDSLVTSVIGGGEAQIWTDNRIHSDGHSRMIIHDWSLKPLKAGRVIQRLMEVETYRNMALLSLPLARSTGPQTAHIDTALAGLTSRMAETSGGDATAEDDSQMLQELSGLSARIERLSASTSYRFSASRAYYALMEARLNELHEERIPGFQNLEEFLDRRMAPAMRTCESVSERLSDLSRRATRAANLLRTRVDFALEAQNQELLTSMARRSRLQLRLQETVEGLSVAAITYYTVSLIGYVAKAVKANGVHVPVELVTGISIPVVAVLVWMGGRRLRKAIMKSEKTG